MRIAVISDIHGNCLALEAVLEDIAAGGIDMTVNLGDLLSGPLEPVRTAELLLECDFPTVAGNHEQHLTTRQPEEMGRVDRFAYDRLSPDHLAWIAGLPGTLSIEGEVFMCHGTPRDAEQPWLDNWFEGRTTTLPDEAAITAEAEGIQHPVLLCGHTHIPRVVRLSGNRLVVNPGSVGLPLHFGSPDARYAVLERRGGDWSVALKTIPYDHAAAARQAQAQGFPHWVEPLTKGWHNGAGLF